MDLLGGPNYSQARVEGYLLSALLPISICEELDRLNRNFLWDGSTDLTHNHLVNWNQVELSYVIKWGTQLVIEELEISAVPVPIIFENSADVCYWGLESDAFEPITLIASGCTWEGVVHF
ncbi:hypothetical protein GOBAR_AA22099 [Gossypium barbadense]|uniref:Uncharacterized protein n=1 Tax=Gossypium barbadense TaxID=3634 RepID=A0A2P5X5I1_GOSBA|nr:hypothetical protein GOBAR_AA22099 [Gossypium barbadense]